MTEQEMNEKSIELKLRAEEYAEDKATESSLKKRLESNNTSIKALMELLNQDEVELSNGSKVTYSITKRESLNEPKLIELLKQVAPETDCVMTKEYIDMDILEKEIYNGQLSDDALQAIEDCRIVKEFPVLNIKKAKKGE